MRSVASLALSLLVLAAGCAPKTTNPAPRAVPMAALPADVRDLAKPAAGDALPAKSAAVAPAPLAATGELVAPMRSRVAPKQAGRAAAVLVREGARVHAGQPLATFETDYLLLDLQRAEAELARAEAMAADAERDLARKSQLVAAQSVSRAAFDHVQATRDEAVAAKKSAAVAVATIRQRIADATLRAPFDGVVEARAIEVGEHVSEGQSAFVLAQTSRLKLRFRLPEKELPSVKLGQLVTATSDAAAAFSGRVAMISGVIDPATRTLVAEADVDNADGRLRPGMFARVAIGN